MCKHQLKALLVKGHSGGVLMQLGTRFGSQYDRIDDLKQVDVPIIDYDHLKGYEHLQKTLDVSVYVLTPKLGS